MNRVILYVLCFPNGKLYVGITTKTAEQRFRRGHCQSEYPVGDAVRKYGPGNVRVVVLHHGLSWAEACELERFYIREFRTRIEEGGYNLTDGGEGAHGRVPSEKSRKATSEFNRRRWADPARRLEMLGYVRDAAAKSGVANRGKRYTGKRLRQAQIAQVKAADVCRGKKFTGERLRKQQIAQAKAAAVRRGKPLSEKNRKALSESACRQWQDPERREKKLIAVRANAIKANEARRRNRLLATTWEGT